MDGVSAPPRGRRRRSKHRCFRCGAGWTGRGTHACADVAQELQGVSSPEQMRAQLLALRREAAGLVRSSAEPRATAALQAALDVLSEVAERSLPADPLGREPLTIALAGRTKAGKSQLVAAMTGDVNGKRVGVGRQRTTRKTTSHELADFTVLDTPGVAALDGDTDTRRALRAMERADAVLWLYAESLQQEEADELEDLLRRGKPVVVAYNAKWAVDKEQRRRIFVSQPSIAFRDLAGHEERIRQIADRAGANPPPFIPIHARAAWWAVKLAHGTGMDFELRHASRIEILEEKCRELLFSRADALRVQKKHDSRRVRLIEYSAACRAVAALLEGEPGELIAEFRAEKNKLLSSIDAVARNAEGRLLADVASARKDIPTWLEKHQGDDADARWNRFLEAHEVLRALDEFVAEVGREVARQGALFEAATALRERFAIRREQKAKPGTGWFGKLKSGVKIAARAGVRMLKDFGVSRGLTKLLAKLGSRSVPYAGWTLVVSDAAAAISAETRDEIKRRRARSDAWEHDMRSLYEAELSDVEAIVRRRLRDSRRALVADVRHHYGQAETVLAKRSTVRHRAQYLLETGALAIAACDKEFVEELASTQGLDLAVVKVDRTPGRELLVEIEDPDVVERAERTLRPLLLSEIVTVTRARPADRKKEK
jgi:hypothetical protein